MTSTCHSTGLKKKNMWQRRLFKRSHLFLPLREGKSLPWHFFEIIIERLLVSVRADEDDVKFLVLYMRELLVPFGQLGREHPAGWAPVGREIQTYNLRQATKEKRRSQSQAVVVGSMLNRKWCTNFSFSTQRRHIHFLAAFFYDLFPKKFYNLRHSCKSILGIEQISALNKPSLSIGMTFPFT